MSMASLIKSRGAVDSVTVVESTKWPRLRGETFPVVRRQTNALAVEVPEHLNNKFRPGYQCFTWWLYFGKVSDGYTFDDATGTYRTPFGVYTINRRELVDA